MKCSFPKADSPVCTIPWTGPLGQSNQEKGSCKQVTKLLENGWKCPTMLDEIGLNFGFWCLVISIKGGCHSPSLGYAASRLMFGLNNPKDPFQPKILWFLHVSLVLESPSCELTKPTETANWSFLPTYSTVCAGLVKWIGERSGSKTSEPR